MVMLEGAALKPEVCFFLVEVVVRSWPDPVHLLLKPCQPGTPPDSNPSLLV